MRESRNNVVIEPGTFKRVVTPVSSLDGAHLLDILLMLLFFCKTEGFRVNF